MTAASSVSRSRLRLALIFAVPILILVGLFLFAAWLNTEPHFGIGMERAEVYERMGEPSNSDATRIAFWSSSGAKSKPWRELLSEDGWVAIFDSGGQTMTYKVALSELNIDSSMTDDDVIAQILGMTNF